VVSGAEAAAAVVAVAGWAGRTSVLPATAVRTTVAPVAGTPATVSRDPPTVTVSAGWSAVGRSIR
jgi:hypothetical protein